MTEPLRVVLASSRADGLLVLLEACQRSGNHPAACVVPRFAADDSRIVRSIPTGLDSVFPAGNDELAEALSGFAADIMICHGFPWRLSEEVLRTVRLGVLNVHTSLLPRHRGPMPVHWALLRGDTETGVTIHRMDSRFDSGPIVAQRGGIPLPDEIDDDAADGLIRDFDDVARELVAVALARVAEGFAGTPQNEQDATYESAIGDELASVDRSKTAREIHNQVRARRFGIYDPPGPIAELDGRRISLLRTSLRPADGMEIRCADGSLWITEFLELDPVDRRRQALIAR
ncbi:methionyl-tRNA formyltransferase [Nocardia alni]|uniref:methionyl-tRNA formyltransferase n=1 Tax=Nocardia alni TaxID=2815723 RepID=UPI001C22D29B|nr:formyltransferase family protein [Nocardia alni]